MEYSPFLDFLWERRGWASWWVDGWQFPIATNKQSLDVFLIYRIIIIKYNLVTKV